MKLAVNISAHSDRAFLNQGQLLMIKVAIRAFLPPVAH